MPIYEYRCSNCGVFETMQRITEPALKRCPTCKAKVERIISNTSFVLKGTGWYATDYARSSNAKSSEKADDKAKTSGESTAPAANGSSGAPSSDSSSSGAEKTPKAKSPD